MLGIAYSGVIALSQAEHTLNKYREAHKRKEFSPQGIAYDYYLTGPQGARYELFPLKTIHGNHDIYMTRRFLRNNFDVVSIKVIWQKP